MTGKDLLLLILICGLVATVSDVIAIAIDMTGKGD